MGLLKKGVVVVALMLSACQSYHPAQPPYRGYKRAQALHYNAVGVASHYEANGARGAIGERLYRGDYYAAHRTLPLPCRARVTNLSNGRSCEVRVADRGPYIAGRIIDVSSAVAHKLDFHRHGLTRVRVEVLSVGDGAYKRTR